MRFCLGRSMWPVIKARFCHAFARPARRSPRRHPSRARRPRRRSRNALCNLPHAGELSCLRAATFRNVHARQQVDGIDSPLLTSTRAGPDVVQRTTYVLRSAATCASVPPFSGVKRDVQLFLLGCLPCSSGHCANRKIGGIDAGKCGIDRACPKVRPVDGRPGCPESDGSA
jgi:hypothetical protein